MDNKDVAIYQLKKAVKNRNLTVIKCILSTNQKISNVDLDDNLLLHEPFHHFKGDLDFEKINVKILQTLLEFGANVNCANNAGHTALHLAINSRMTQAIDLLITHGAKLDVDKAGNSIVHFLIKQEFEKCKLFHNFKQDRVPLASLSEKFQTESSEFIELILSKELEYVDLQNYEGDTPLHLAAKHNLTYALEILLKYTTDVKIVNDCGETAFQVFFESIAQTIISMGYNKIKFVEEICEKFEEKEKSLTITGASINALLHCALKQRMRRLAKLMLKYMETVDTRDEEGNTALNTIMHYDLLEKLDEELVSILLEKGVDIHALNNQRISPLIAAVRNKKLSILQIFVKHNANFQHCHSEKNLLHHLFESKILVGEQIFLAVFMLLTTQGCDLNDENKEGKTPLYLAVKRGKSEIVDSLIKQGVNMNTREKSNGYSLLHVATIDHNCEIAKLLIEAKVDVNVKDNEGMTPLHFAARNGNLDIARMLLTGGANVHSIESFRAYTPLHLAILHVKNELAKFLIQKGANVNAKTTKGKTPFHLLSNNNVELAEYLLSAGAHIDVKDNDGFLPLQIAISCRYDIVIRELLRFGADINDNARALRETHRESTSKCIREYLMKIEAAGGYIDKELAIYVGYNYTQADILFNRRCSEELDKLKNYKINEDISLYDFLQINRNSACKCIKNKKLKDLIRSSTFEQQFPLYHVLISCTFYQAIERQLLLKPAENAWNKITKISLPKNCTYQILSNLSNIDLRVMTLGE